MPAATPGTAQRPRFHPTATRTELIRRYVDVNGPTSIRKISLDLEINVNTVRGALGRLVKRGQVVSRGGGLYNGV